MRLLLFSLSLIITFYSVESQTLKINKRSGEVKEIEIEKINSLRMAPPITEADIGGTKSVDFGIVACADTEIEKTIRLVNIGDKQLFITHSEFSPQGPFKLSTEQPLILSIEPKASYSFSVFFKPDTSGEYNSSLIITSNAASGLKYKIELKGILAEQKFSIGNSAINAGGLCPLSVKEIKIPVTNSGSGECTVKAQSNTIELQEYEISIPAGGHKDCIARIRTSAQTGTYTGRVLFSDICNKTDTAEIQWDVQGPVIECKSVVDLTAKPGETATADIFIENKSNDTEFKWNGAELSNSQFELSKVKFPLTIKPGGAYFAKVIYKPTSSQPVTAYLTIKGTPCDIELKVPLKGSSGNIEMIFSDSFENSETGEFPYSNGWQWKNYGGSDSIPYVSGNTASEGKKSLYAWGFFGPPQSVVNYMKVPIKNTPNVIFAECDIKINQIGFCGMGLLKSTTGSFEQIPFCIEFGNHAHFYYDLGSQEKRWDNDGYAPMQWYRLTFKFDKLNKCVFIWVNGLLVAEDSAPELSDNCYDTFYLSAGGGHSEGGSAYFDNVRIWTVKE